VRQDLIKPAPGASKPSKRVGRGHGSGHGTYSGRGVKGQQARQGYSRKPGFEGGQLSLVKRLPQKRGFVNVFREEYSVVNVGTLNNMFKSGDEVTLGKLVEARIVKSLGNPLKVLANGEMDHPLVIKANKFSAAAKAKIEAAGGKAEEVSSASSTG
jgi:large subunit ribosomal protein L15